MISIKQYDRRTEVSVHKALPIGIFDIKKILENLFIRTKVTFSHELNDMIIFRLHSRLIIKQVILINKRLHELAGIEFKQKKSKTKVEKDEKQVDENIIVGFKENLILGFEWIFKS